MYTLEKLTSIENEVKNKKLEAKELRKNIFNNVFLISNISDKITFQFIEKTIHEYSLEFKFLFNHALLNNKIAIEVKFDYRDNKRIHEMHYINPKAEVGLQRISSPNSVNLTVKQYGILGELMAAISFLINKINKKQLKSNIEEYESTKKLSTKMFREAITYKSKLNMQEKRIKFAKYFNSLTKQRTEEECQKLIDSKQTFSFVTFNIAGHHSKEDSLEFTFKECNISYSTNLDFDKIYCNESPFRIETILEDFCHHSVFINGQYLTNLDQIADNFFKDYQSNFSIGTDFLVFYIKEFKETMHKISLNDKLNMF
jgi:hypothetical protein